MTGILFKKSPVVTVVATGVGAALFFILGRFAVIPLPIPNTNINIQYAVLAVFALVYGPVSGFLIGLVGHWLVDVSLFGAWWSWILTSAVLGLLIGLLNSKVTVEQGKFKGKTLGYFIFTLIVSNAICWCLVAPVLDILVYAEPANKVFVQGATAGICNAVTSIVIGSIVALAYANTKTAKGSLTEHVDD